jgi:tetratricopeptide (TPR) repeat protein
MNSLRGFDQKLVAVSRHWDDADYDSALAEVEQLLEKWPGNGHLHILWASLVQLQEDPKHPLEEAKQALQRAIDLDRSSPAAAIELGHFLDAVDDDPRAASKAYSGGVVKARHLLIEGLIGQAKVLLQMGKKGDALECIREVLHSIRFDPKTKRGKAEESNPDLPFGSVMGDLVGIQLDGPYANQIEELLSELWFCAKPADQAMIRVT